jgi:hypothetical protein
MLKARLPPAGGQVSLAFAVAGPGERGAQQGQVFHTAAERVGRKILLA